MAEIPQWPNDPAGEVSSGPWREVRGGLPAQDLHLDPQHTPPPLRLEQSDHWLGRIAIYYHAHPTIPGLYQCCFDYIEPWDWSRQTEHVATGRWIRGHPDGI